MWGLTGGVLAGLVDGPVRGVLQAPTRALTWWLAEVAGRSAALPLGELRAGHAAAVALGAVLALVVRRPWARRVGPLAVLTGVAAAMAAVPHPPDGRTGVADGVELWRHDGTSLAVLGGGARPRYALEGLRQAGVRCVDAVVVAGGGLPVRR